MAKTFAKITKIFVGLSATIVAKGRRLVLILHLKEKYEKQTAKMKSMRKTGQEAPVLQKVNSEKKSMVNSQSQWSTTMMTSAR